MIVPIVELEEPKLLQEDYITRHGEDEWERCNQGKCNNPKCPYPHRMWWNNFLFNPEKPDKHLPLMDEWYLTSNNKHHYASTTKPKIHRCMKKNPPGKWINKSEYSCTLVREDHFNIYFEVSENDEVKRVIEKKQVWQKMTPAQYRDSTMVKIPSDEKKKLEAFTFEY